MTDAEIMREKQRKAEEKKQKEEEDKIKEEKMKAKMTYSHKYGALDEEGVDQNNSSEEQKA